MIWIWRVPEKWADKRIGNCVKNTGTDRFEFQKAIILNEENTTCPNIIFECEEKYLFDVLPNSGSLLVVSRKVLDILKCFCPEDFQVFEANVYAKDKKITGYYLLNLLVSLNVVDKENSAFKTMKNSNAILKFDKIVYNVENILDFDIIRNSDYLSHVLVSTRLKEAFEKEKIKGVEFRDATIVT